MKTLESLTPVSLPEPSAPETFDVDAVLQPLFEIAASSSSLLASTYPVATHEGEFKIPKFLLLGQRGGGKPIRLALFSGLDAGSRDTTFAIARLLLQYRLNPALARDYALFAYPLVNRGSLATPPVPLASFERRYALSPADEDVAYFKAQSCATGSLTGCFFCAPTRMRRGSTQR